jgi:hypothetical protein
MAGCMGMSLIRARAAPVQHGVRAMSFIALGLQLLAGSAPASDMCCVVQARDGEPHGSLSVAGLVHVWSTRHRNRAVPNGLQRCMVRPGGRCDPAETRTGAEP